MVMMKRVAVGRTARGFDQAMGIRSKSSREWQRHNLDEQETAGGHHRTEEQADGGKEVLVEGREVWEGRTGQTVEDIEWRKEVKGQWRAKEQAAVRRGQNKDLERDKVYDICTCMTKVENGQRHGRRCPGWSLLCLVTFLSPFIRYSCLY